MYNLELVKGTDPIVCLKAIPAQLIINFVLVTVINTSLQFAIILPFLSVFFFFSYRTRRPLLLISYE